MTRLKAANNAQSTLKESITVDPLSTSLEVDDASSFPAAPFMITVNDEIMRVTEVAGAVFTVTRAREDTVAADHTAGDSVENRWTAGSADEIYGELDTHVAEKVHQTEVHGLRATEGKLEYYDGAEWKTVSGGLPVGNVSSFEANAGDTEVTLIWIDPSDLVVDDVTIATWAGTKILRKTGSYPANENDGALVVNSSVRDQYSSTGYTDTGLTNDTEYYYMAFPYTDEGIYTVDETNRITATPTDVKLYGVQWNYTTDSYARLDDASALTVGSSTGGQAITSDFDNVFPWSDIRRCNLSDAGVVNAYHGDPLYIEDGTNGQVMVEIPKFWYKSELDITTDKIYKWWISDNPTDGFSVHPAFIRNSVEKDKIYISAYEGNVSSNIMRSIIGVQPSTDTNVSNGTIVGFRDYAQARGAGWEMQDFLTVSAIQLLYLIEFATFDTQTSIGRGVVDKASGSANESNNTGATSFLGSASGRQSGTDGLTSVSFRGVENFWGNIWKWTDGLNLNDYEAFIANYGFESNKFTSPYASVGSVLSTSDTYIKDIVFNGLDFGFLASEGGGSSSTRLHDNWWVASGQRVARFGGPWNADSRAGGFCWSLADGSAVASRAGGSRLAFFGS